MADGLYNLAWRSLQEASAHEFDERVLEALKVGQVCCCCSLCVYAG